LTGGASEGTPIAKVAEKVGEKVGAKVGAPVLKGALALVGAPVAVAVIAVIALVASIGVVFSAISGGGGGIFAPPPTTEQQAAMPAGWAKISYAAQQSAGSSTWPAPWTLIAGLAKVETNYNDTSPYDTTARFPDRPAPAYLLKKFPDLAGTNGTGATSEATCATQPHQDIGGGPNQGVGPFLLLPGAAADMVKDHKDPYNPCEAASFVAKRVTAAADELRKLDKWSGVAAPPYKDADKMWMQAVQNAAIMASPTLSAAVCTPRASATVAGKVNVDQVITDLFGCVLARAAALHVVSDATVVGATVTFSEYDVPTAVTMVTEEARTVSYAYSKWNNATCKPGDPLAGIFPLTQTQATQAGEPNRCDVVANVRAAAKIVAAGEVGVPTGRSTAGGPYAPMLGGWASITGALGTDGATLSLVGTGAQWAPSAACTAVMTAFLTRASKPGSPFAALGAAGAAMPANTAAYTRYLTSLGGGPAANPACVSGSPEQVSTSLSEIAGTAGTLLPGTGMPVPLTATQLAAYNRAVATTLAATDALTPLLTPTQVVAMTAARKDFTDAVAATLAAVKAQDYDAYTTAARDLGAALYAVGEASGLPAPGAPALPAAPVPNPVVAAAQRGLSLWYSVAATPPPLTPGVWGLTSMVDRLSLHLSTIPAAPRQAVADLLPADPWQTRALDWAVFYGGVAPEWSTFGVRGTTMQLVAAVNTVAAWGTANQKVTVVINAAKTALGLPYSWGGGTPAGPSRGFAQGAAYVGFDCSSLTQFAYAKAGFMLARVTTGQEKQGTAVANMASALPGDLIFYGPVGSTHHVTMYLGGGQMIAAPSTGDHVKIQAVYGTPSVIRRIFQATAAGGGPSGPMVAGTSAQVTKWITDALTVLYANGTPRVASDATIISWMVYGESSGNPRAINLVDSNFKAGHPSKGLIQTIDSTFQAYRLPSLPNDVYDPVSNIVAGVRYNISRYHSMENNPGWKSHKAGGGYVGY